MYTVYSRTPLYGHPLNTETPLLWTVFFVPLNMDTVRTCVPEKVVHKNK